MSDCNRTRAIRARGARRQSRVTGSLKHSILAIALCLVSACEREADLDNLAEYSNGDMKFTMPGNWAVTEDVEEDGFRYLFIETSGDAIVVITAYPLEDSIPLRDYVDWTIESSVEEFPIGSRDAGSVMEIRKPVADRVYGGFRNEFVVTLAGIEVPHTATYFGFATKRRAAYISTQVATEDLDKVDRGFDLVISTFELQ